MGTEHKSNMNSGTGRAPTRFAYCRLQHTSEYDKSQKDGTSLHEDNAKLDRTVVYIASRCLCSTLSFSLVVDRRQYALRCQAVGWRVAKSRSVPRDV
jgi:hypothetical protein